MAVDLQQGAGAPAAVVTPAATAALRYGPVAPQELDAIRALLASLQLPASDVGGPHQEFLAAREGQALVGCVGLEACGEDALLRSLAVLPRLQGTGIGRALHERAVAAAQARGARALYLLTTTAEPFFARAGYRRIDRATVPAQVSASPEFSALCPASAVCMVRRLR